jgi:IS1 family transposase
LLRRLLPSPASKSYLDAVVALRVEGVSISAIARLEGIAWNTVARWLERAAQTCRRFNQGRIVGFVVEELQADGIRSFAGSKDRSTWIFAAIEVWSRLWPSTVVGRRSYRNTLALVRDVTERMDFEGLPLIVTDGFNFYEKVVRRVFGPAALYGQVLKTGRNDRIVKVERRELLGATWRFEEALNDSEDFSKLNTSFIERLNLTIRQSSAYVARRTLSHARSKEKLEEHLELLRCYYNFARPTAL